jgi:hypothetical protein
LSNLASGGPFTVRIEVDANPDGRTFRGVAYVELARRDPDPEVEAERVIRYALVGTTRGDRQRRRLHGVPPRWLCHGLSTWTVWQRRNRSSTRARTRQIHPSSQTGTGRCSARSTGIASTIVASRVVNQGPPDSLRCPAPKSLARRARRGWLADQ